MSNELKDFEYFKKYQLHCVNFDTGQIDTKGYGSNQFGIKYLRISKNVGSLNEDGYTRVWCNKRLRMKHRLLYYLYHNEMPDEIDHIDRNRQNNAITNLRNVCRKQQLQNLTKGIKRKKQSIPVKTIHNICKELLTNKNYTQIANKYGCSRCYVRDIATKRRQIKISSKYF